MIARPTGLVLAVLAVLLALGTRSTMDVHCDRPGHHVEVGADARATGVEPAGSSPQPDEAFVDEFLGQPRVTESLAAVAEERALVALDELVERSAEVTTPDACDQLGFFTRSVTASCPCHGPTLFKGVRSPAPLQFTVGRNLTGGVGQVASVRFVPDVARSEEHTSELQSP